MIRALRSAGHQVRVGAFGGGLDLLRSEFPDLEIFPFPGYRVRYSRSALTFVPVLLAQAPWILLGLAAEARALRRILVEKPCDLVISDGRYGLVAPGIPCILITHQVAFRVPGRFPGQAFAERMLLRLNLACLRRFDRVWVPDFEGALSLSGSLGRPPGIRGNLEWIGPLSRFAPGTGADRPMPKVDAAAVVSGPEPQRSLFEAVLRKELAKLPGTRVLVRGLPGGRRTSLGLESIVPGNLAEFDHLRGEDLARLFTGAELLIVRSGYTTVMELAGLGAKAVILVPTPGQSEQEHLASHLEALGAGVRMEQHKLDLEAGRARTKGLAGFGRWREAMSAGTHLERFLASHPLLGTGAAIPIPNAAQQ